MTLTGQDNGADDQLGDNTDGERSDSDAVVVVESSSADQVGPAEPRRRSKRSKRSRSRTPTPSVEAPALRDEAGLDERERRVELREQRVEEREKELARDVKRLEGEKAETAAAKKVADLRRTESIQETKRAVAREEAARAAEAEALAMRRAVETLGGSAQEVRRESRFSRRVQLVGLIIAVLAAVIAGGGWYTDRATLAEERQETERLKAAARAKLVEEYVVLPATEDLLPSPSTATVRRIEKVYNGAYLVTDHRYFTNESLSYGDLVPQTAHCWSPECEAVLNRQAPLDFRTVYLRIENTGSNDATDLDVRFQPYSPDPVESDHFVSVFGAPQDAESFDLDDALPPTLRHGESVLIPVATVAMFPVGGGHTYIGIRDTRMPLTQCWRDDGVGARICKRVRPVNDEPYLFGPDIPGGG